MRRIIRSTPAMVLAAAALTIALPGCGFGTVCGGTDGATCSDGRFCQRVSGFCGDDNALGVCTEIPDICTLISGPVCGCDGTTYGNACLANAAGVSIDHDGECNQVCGGIAGLPCPDGLFCNMEADRCCCDHQGVCTVAPDECIEIFEPVCGCDAMTYVNSCFAEMAGVNVDHDGECDDGQQPG